MGREKEDRKDDGPSIRIPADFLKNPLLLIFLSLMSGGTGVTLFVEDDKHKVVAEQLQAIDDRLTELQVQLVQQCGTCSKAVESAFPLQTKLFEIGQDVKSLHWEFLRYNTDLEIRLHNNLPSSTIEKVLHDDEDD